MTDFVQAFARLNAYIRQHMLASNNPGVSLAITGREQVLYENTYGYAEVASKHPVSPGSLFEIGSIGKAFTSTVVMQLVESGQLDLAAPVNRYLPWFSVRTSSQPITLHHLLSHTAGLINGMDFTGEARYEVLALRNTAAAPAGARFHYSNVGYKIVGVLLEDLLEKPYNEIIQARLLDPLEMHATEAVITHAAREHLATGYQGFYDDRPAHPSHRVMPATWLETSTADGCIASTAGDMANFLRMLLNRGQAGVLSQAGFELMARPVIKAWEEHAYGYGLTISEIDSYQHIGHGGGMVGYTSTMLVDMDNGFGVIVLANGPDDTFDIADFALKCLRGAQLEGPLPELPSKGSSRQVDQAKKYAGEYRSTDKSFRISARGDKLRLDYGAERIPLERREPDRFYAKHPDFDRFLLSFTAQDGKIVEAFHGTDWFVNERYRGPKSFAIPAEWQAYPGHYRCHNPWYSNFRVVARKGALLLIWPSGKEIELKPLGDSQFRVGAEELSPERLRFDAIIAGKALRANLSGCDYYRTFTP